MFLGDTARRSQLLNIHLLSEETRSLCGIGGLVMSTDEEHISVVRVLSRVAFRADRVDANALGRCLGQLNC